MNTDSPQSTLTEEPGAFAIEEDTISVDMAEEVVVDP